MAEDIHPSLAGVDTGDLTNREPRCPLVLLLDTSYSMVGPKLDKLQEGVNLLTAELSDDSLARLRVDVAMVTFGGEVRVQRDFTTVGDLQAPTLVAEGGTPMGAAVTHALSMVDARKRRYKELGLDYYQPWVFLLTDGEPTDDISQAARQVRELEDQRRINFFGVGIGDEANLDTLGQLSHRAPKKLAGLRFNELFQWLSKSLKVVSSSTPGDRPPKIPTTASWDEPIL